MSELGSEYEHTDEEAIAIGEAAKRYIVENVAENLPLGFRGLPFYGVVRMLRENDAEFHGPDCRLDEQQRKRLGEIETDLETAVATKLQYYPFGNDRNRAFGEWDEESNQRQGQRLHSSWNHVTHRQHRHHST